MHRGYERLLFSKTERLWLMGTKYLYCIDCRMPGHLPVSDTVMQERQQCRICNGITIHRDVENVFDVADLLEQITACRNALTKIYYDNEAACGCECAVETCCVKVGEPCAKCDSRTGLLAIKIPTAEGAQPSPTR